MTQKGNNQIWQQNMIYQVVVIVKWISQEAKLCLPVIRGSGIIARTQEPHPAKTCMPMGTISANETQNFCTEHGSLTASHEKKQFWISIQSLKLFLRKLIHYCNIMWVGIFVECSNTVCQKCLFIEMKRSFRQFSNTWWLSLGLLLLHPIIYKNRNNLFQYWMPVNEKNNCDTWSSSRNWKSYRNISWSLEATRFRFKLFKSPWNLTGTSAAHFQDASQISERYNHYNTQSCGFKTLAIRGLTA